ncbi:hypothetical protein MMC14_006373 [Varicellaria rhodocarpa]|nr:hypothetical protein [Varicellaria rhodocarpa]
MDPNNLAWSLELPIIHTICGRGTESEDSCAGRSECLASLDSGSSTLTCLELQVCRLRMGDIAKLLRIPKALCTFIYELASKYCWSFDVSFTAIREALTAQEHCLEILWLDLDPLHDCGFRNYYNDTIPMVLFASFKKLKVLRLQTIHVFGREVDGYEQGNEETDEETDEEIDVGTNGWNLEGDGNEGKQENQEVDTESIAWNTTSCCRFTFIFPTTLEMLHFTRCLEHFPRLLLALRDLLKYKSEQVPALSKLVLEGDFYEAIYEARWLQSYFINLVAQGREQGVLVVFIHTRDRSRSISYNWNPAAIPEWRIDREWNGLAKGTDDFLETASFIMRLDPSGEQASDIIRKLNGM